VLVGAAAAALAGRRPVPLLAALWVALLLLGPLLPVLHGVSPRSLILVALVAAGVTAWVLARMAHQSPPWPRRLAPVVAALLVLPAPARVLHDADRDAGDRRRYRLEGTHVLKGPADQTLADPIGPPWYYEGLAWIRREVLTGGPAPRVCEEVCLCRDAAGWVRVSDGQLVPWSPPADLCHEEVREDAPLEAHLRYRHGPGTLSWRLGPYPSGRWSYIDLRTVSRKEIPAAGRFPYRLADALAIRVEYRSPEGWVTRSPRLVLDPAALGADGVLDLRFHR
jgi:hypothetical protein